jgi:hypothetical protein
MIQDITERRRSEEELSRAQAYLAESERLSHIGTWPVNVITQQIVFWSDEHYRIFGFDPECGAPDCVLPGQSVPALIVAGSPLERKMDIVTGIL